jgi:hypothetical protein
MTEDEMRIYERQNRQDEENKRLGNQKFNYMVEMGAIDPQEEEASAPASTDRHAPR